MFTIGNDDSNNRTRSIQLGTMTKIMTKSNKPIMEKRRRARINHCLNELKTLILDAMKKDPARHSKLEKADILEMTVKHLQTIQRQQMSTAMSTDPAVIHKFKNGFNECATEVSRYISHMEGIETGVKQRLVSHLASCVNGLQQISPSFSSSTYHQGNLNNNNNNNNQLFGNNSVIGMTSQNLQMPPPPSEDVNNNQASNRLQNMMTSLQLIPSRLPSGELALLLPNSQSLPGNVLPLFHSPSSIGNTTPSSLQVQQELVKNPHNNLPTEPNSTITSSTIDRTTPQQQQKHHMSAFTAVCRPTPLLKDNHRNVTVIKSPLPSPTSSVTSTTSSIHYEDTTPPKTNSSTTTTSEISPNTSEISPSLIIVENQKNKLLTTKLHSPPVLAVKPLSLLKELNIRSENNNDLIKYYNNNNNNENNNNPTTLLQQIQKQNLMQQQHHQTIPIQIPLTVITNDNINNRLSNPPSINNDIRYQHPALDYSIKKENDIEERKVLVNNVGTSLKRSHNNIDSSNDENNDIRHNHSEMITMTSPLSFSPKIIKLSTDFVSNNNIYYKTAVEDNNTQNKVDENFAESTASTSFETTKSDRSTTTTKTHVTSEINSCNNNSNNSSCSSSIQSGDMWRPW